MLKSNYSFLQDRQGIDAGMPLENIGQKLRSAREAQGLTLVQVYERTKIPLNHLQSIEQGNAEDLPETFYVSGFIKRYAESVGLDGQVLSDEYRLHLEEHRGKKKGKGDNSLPLYAMPEYVSKTRLRVATPMYKLWLFNGIILIGVVGTITWFINSQVNNIANQPDPSLISLKESTSRLMPNNPGQTPAGQPANTDKTPVPTNSNEKLSISAIRHVWVEVKKVSTGENAYTGFMEQGDRRDFEDSQGLIVRAGDGGGLSVERQGRIESFGLAGKITERTFSVPASPTVTPVEKSAPVATSGGTTTTTSTTNTTAVRPVSKYVPPKRVSSGTEGSSHSYRRIEDSSRQYVPGESLGGGTRSIDVPYRYSEGRLDSE
ncbi:MAG: helix-turn-helix domain-containing protein [Candidatus Obscuribacterales bacterium]|nr:helix-turn-helix domain-containing protein [Candidatus Obscuribacterales bacterium]